MKLPDMPKGSGFSLSVPRTTSGITKVPESEIHSEDAERHEPLLQSLANSHPRNVDSLRIVNDIIRAETRAKIEAINARSSVSNHIKLESYPLPNLKLKISQAIQSHFAPDLEVVVCSVSRDRFKADLTVKVPELLKRHGPKVFNKEIAPKIKSALETCHACSDAIDDISLVGQFVNIKLKDIFVVHTLACVQDLGTQFGTLDTERSEKIIVDYSSPNAAKQLHAGHIRSTICGHVLANLHEACGATVYRVNHINDIGGFGYLLEGFRRWRDSFPEATPNHTILKDLYRLRRTMESASKHSGEYVDIPQNDREFLERFVTTRDLKTVREEFAEFSRAADFAAEQLEQGDPVLVAQWREMVGWSLSDFESFYSALNIHLDFPLGESFYIQDARRLIEEGLNSGQVTKWTDEAATAAKLDLDSRLLDGVLSNEEHRTAVESIQRDIGATVVPLKNGERLVVLRSDGRSIYATRDLGAIMARRELFDASQIIYVAGQEQCEHFENVFEAARKIGSIVADTDLKHIYFGFYIDATSKKKLSSREGAANVSSLLQESVRYFADKFASKALRGSGNSEEISRSLAIGSVVFNDLRKDLRASVEINGSSITQTIEDFEKAGGAYAIYATCRARGIIEKFGKEIPSAAEISQVELSGLEVSLITLIQELPEKIAEASRGNNPVILSRHLLQLAGEFNSFYSSHPVIKDGKISEHRLILAAAANRALENGLRLCHVNCPNRI